MMRAGALGPRLSRGLDGKVDDYSEVIVTAKESLPSGAPE